MMDGTERIGRTVWGMDIAEGRGRIALVERTDESDFGVCITSDTSDECGPSATVISYPLTRREAYDLIGGIANAFHFEGVIFYGKDDYKEEDE